jgi:predicted lipopolysaccharide heptosyltransferase III
VNILLLQLKRIGDLVLTTPAIAALREKFPEAVLTLIVSHESAALLPAIAGIDRVFVVKRKLGDLKIYRTVSREKFDWCIDFTRNDRSALLTSLSRAKKRVVSNPIKLHSRFRASAYTEFVNCSTDDMHTIDYYLALLEPFGLQEAPPEIKLQLPSGASEDAEQTRKSFKIDNPFIVFHPGSARIEKFWDAQSWAEVIAHARSVMKLQPVLTSGNSRLEQDHIAQIKRKLPGHAIVDLAGKIDLLALAALIAQARFVVTVDTASMHLAAAMHTPQVVLFGPTNPFHWRPRETTALILQGRSASPRSSFTPDEPRFAMNDISTEAVINAMNSLLSISAEIVS